MSGSSLIKKGLAIIVILLFIGMDFIPSTGTCVDTDIDCNNPPTAPIFLGPTHGVVGESYRYTINSTDPDGDDVCYIVIWEPGVLYEWFGPYPSGEEIDIGHTWDEPGTYYVLSQAADVHNAESDVTILEIVIGEIIYVDDDNTEGPWNGTAEYPYQYIQDGIDNASEYDTVFVYNGTYFEHIIIDKELILIGEILEETILDGFFEKELIDIYSSFVTIKNFTLQRSKHHPISVGDYYSHFAGIYISNCNFTDCDGGMYFENVSDIFVFNCSFSNIDGPGIDIIPPSNNISVNHCFINNCNNYGICIGGSNISIENCHISNHTYRGIAVGGGSKDCSFSNNVIINNAGGGIIISDLNSRGTSSIISILFNKIVKNGKGGIHDAGIFVSDCLKSVIIESNNIINNDGDGIYLLRTSEIVINQNEISQNQRRGLFLDASSQNLIHHNNFINNKINAFFLNSTYNKWNDNYWNRPRLLPKPIFGTIKIGSIWIPWFNIDWHPAKEPYEVTTFDGS